MILAAPNIREGLFLVLGDGGITYDGVSIPVYEGMGGEGIIKDERNYQIIISSMDYVENNTKRTFFGEWNCVIECRAEMQGSPVRRYSDGIANEVMQKLTPVRPGVNGFAVDGFQVLNAKWRSVRHLIEEGNGSSLVRTILTLTFNLNKT